MGFTSWVMTRIAKLEKSLTRSLKMERDLEVPMVDGAVLLADRYAPRDGDGLPVVLIGTPYGRRSKSSPGYAEIFASRGYQVVVQSCRGTFGSGGEWLSEVFNAPFEEL